MAGDFFNGWPEDGEPVSRLSDRLRSRECECPAPKSNCRMHDDNEAADEIEIGKKLAFRPHVQEVHYVAGEDAFLVKLRGSDTEEIGRLVRETIRPIEGVQLTKTSIVMSTYKETAQFPIENGEKQS